MARPDPPHPKTRAPDPKTRPEAPLAFATSDDWEHWLQRHGQASDSAWLKIAKRSSPQRTVTHAEALEVAIAHGWIDAVRRGLDEHYFLQRFTPRRARSRWSQINRAKAEELIAQGRMRPGGLEQVRLAQADGRWEAAYPPQRDAPVPADLQAALDANSGAAGFFATLTGARRYAFLHRLHNVKTPAARARRIERYIELLEAGRTLTD